MKIRIKFTKQGSMKFIGHLDIMRYFQKAMRRADVDIRYSEGFRPHQVMSFAAPLGVGLTSNGEYLDIEVSHTDSSAEMVRRLNGVMTEGIQVLSYKKLPDTTSNAMSIVAAADYTLCFRDGYLQDDRVIWMEGLGDYLGGETLPFLKKTKKAEREVDMKPLIYQYQIYSDFIYLQVSTGSIDNLKPEMVIDAYCMYSKFERMPFAIQIQREEVYANIGGELGKKLVPLEQLGENIE